MRICMAANFRFWILDFGFATASFWKQSKIQNRKSQIALRRHADLDLQVLKLVFDAAQKLTLDFPPLQGQGAENELDRKRRIADRFDAEHLRIVQDHWPIHCVLAQVRHQVEKHTANSLDVLAAGNVQLKDSLRPFVR